MRLAVALHRQKPSQGYELDLPVAHRRLLPVDRRSLTPPSLGLRGRHVVEASSHLLSRPAGVFGWPLPGRRDLEGLSVDRHLDLAEVLVRRRLLLSAGGLAKKVGTLARCWPAPRDGS